RSSAGNARLIRRGKLKTDDQLLNWPINSLQQAQSTTDNAGSLEKAVANVASECAALAGEERVNKLLRTEWAQVIDLFTNTDEADRQAQLLGDGENDAAFRGTIQLG